MIHSIARSLALFGCALLLNVHSVHAQKKNQAFIDSVACYICASNIAHKEIVMHQAIVETGWFRAEFLMSRNNLFGFRSKNYLRFNNWKESVDYYEQWQKKRYTNPKEDYYKFLERIKYGAAGYTTGLRKIKYTLKCPCAK
ncbi:MAG: glucosaminidase domain-containing protein [Flavobacteriales bacterium]